MKKILFLTFLMGVLFQSCKDDNDPDIDIRPDGKANRTVLAYIIGDNGSNDLSSYMLSDFAEMMEGMSSVDETKNNLIVYCQTKRDLPQLIHLKKRKGVVIADTIHTYTEHNSVESSVMSEVFERVFDGYPAESYGVIFASHGEGWLEAPKTPNTRWFGDYRGTYMNIPTLRDVLLQLPHLDFIFFDACYMQAIEVAYELRHCADYIISSPTEIPGPGAPYQIVVPLMFADKKDVATDIANGYYTYYKDYKGEYFEGGVLWDWIYGVSVSAIKTTELESLAQATAKVLVKYATGNTINTQNLFCYGRSSYYDLDSLVKLLADENDYTAWRAVFDLAQPYFKTTPRNWANNNGGLFDMIDTGGISTCIPRSKTSSYAYYTTLDWYKSGGWEEAGW